jgi:hypothetical protein
MRPRSRALPAATAGSHNSAATARTLSRFICTLEIGCAASWISCGACHPLAVMDDDFWKPDDADYWKDADWKARDGIRFIGE